MKTQEFYDLIEASCNEVPDHPKITAAECLTITKTVLRLAANVFATDNPAHYDGADILHEAHKVLTIHEF